MTRRFQDRRRQLTGKIDFDEMENNLVRQWYYVSKIMATILPPSFPYFTFRVIAEEIQQDENFNHKGN